MENSRRLYQQRRAATVGSFHVIIIPRTGARAAAFERMRFATVRVYVYTCARTRINSVFGVGCLQAFSVLLMILRYWHLVPLLFVKCYQYAAPTQHPMVSYSILKRPNSYVSESMLTSLFIQIFYSTGFLSTTLIRCYTSAICCHLI